MTAPEVIRKLVEKYTFRRNAYLRGQAKTQLSRQIAATDRAIDKLVYKLYG